MARQFTDIKEEMTHNFITDEIIISRYQLKSDESFDQQFSKVSIENILFGVIAFAIWTLEMLFDQFKIKINEEIANSRIHTQKWYKEKALTFMLGYNLNDSDIYDISDLTDEEIISAKIIANAAPVKMQGYLRMKVVKSVSNELAPLSQSELTSFSSYINYVTDAGTYVIPTSGQADDLKLTLDIYYNPMVLAGDGSMLNGSDNTPVLKAIKAYLKSLKFNGSFVKSKLEDELKNIEGITMINVKNAWSKYGSYSYDSTTNPNIGIIDEIRPADAGYMKLDESNTMITYIPYEDYE